MLTTGKVGLVAVRCYHGRDISAVVLNALIARSAIASRATASGSPGSVMVRATGGLWFDGDACDQLVQQAKALAVDSTLAPTNGSLLDLKELIRLERQSHLNSEELSEDGVTDCRRNELVAENERTALRIAVLRQHLCLA